MKKTRGLGTKHYIKFFPGIAGNKGSVNKIYTGFQNSGAIQAFVEYIAPKALKLKSKRSQHSSDDDESSHSHGSGPKPWSSHNTGNTLAPILCPGYITTVEALYYAVTLWMIACCIQFKMRLGVLCSIEYSLMCWY